MNKETNETVDGRELEDAMLRTLLAAREVDYKESVDTTFAEDQWKVTYSPGSDFVKVTSTLNPGKVSNLKITSQMKALVDATVRNQARMGN